MTDSAGFDVSQMLAALQAIGHRVVEATEDASVKGADILVKQAQDNAKGPPGPLERTGALVDSIFADPPQQTSPTDWFTDYAPHVVYGRIQELGGTIFPKAAKVLSWIGLDGRRQFAHRVTLPARPYMSPAPAQAAGALTQMLVDTWGDAITGG